MGNLTDSINPQINFNACFNICMSKTRPNNRRGEFRQEKNFSDVVFKIIIFRPEIKKFVHPENDPQLFSSQKAELFELDTEIF